MIFRSFVSSLPMHAITFLSCCIIFISFFLSFFCFYTYSMPDFAKLKNYSSKSLSISFSCSDFPIACSRYAFAITSSLLKTGLLLYSSIRYFAIISLTSPVFKNLTSLSVLFTSTRYFAIQSARLFTYSSRIRLWSPFI